MHSDIFFFISFSSLAGKECLCKKDFFFIGASSFSYRGGREGATNRGGEGRWKQQQKGK